MPERLRILMVDNNPGDLELASLAMAEAGVDAQFETALDGVEGRDALERIARAERPPVDLVLLDLNMPRMGGRDVLAWARTQEALRALPIVVLTSSHLGRDRDDCLALGATRFAVKPTDFSDYVRLMGEVAALATDRGDGLARP